MSHYNSYDSFKTKRSIEKKNRAKSVAENKEISSDFIIKEDFENSTGIVIETSYRNALVLYEGRIIEVFGMQKNIPCNQIMFPGDYVKLSSDKKHIEGVFERSTILSRDHTDSTRRSSVATNKIIAVNIDCAVIVVSAYSPPLHPKFIDRYLMILQDCGIEPIICLNKCDLKTIQDEQTLDIYRNLGIKVVETSAVKNLGIEDLKECIKNKRAIFVGHSGVGKSSLTNRLLNNDEIKTGCVGEKSLKGRHTTTTSKYYEWAENSSIIDTPGIRALDISKIKANEVQTYFTEFKNYLNCKYRTCDHVHIEKKDCGVKQAVERGDIPLGRYESYRRIIDEINGENSKKNDTNENERML